MADIDVVKKSSRTWLWVVIALAIILMLWFMMAGGGNSTPRTSLDTGGQPLLAALQAVPFASAV